MGVLSCSSQPTLSSRGADGSGIAVEGVSAFLGKRPPQWNSGAILGEPDQRERWESNEQSSTAALVKEAEREARMQRVLHTRQKLARRAVTAKKVDGQRKQPPRDKLRS